MVDTDKAREVFDVMDSMGEGSGTITVADLSIGVRELGFTPSNREIQGLVSEYCIDRTAATFADFERVCKGVRAKLTKAEVTDALNLFDPGDRGAISAGDMQQVLTLWGDKLTDIEANEFITEVGKGGKVSIAEVVEAANVE
eukprot:m.50446 g.50446  ORF g.50446 m.50446 type:complete len:142 (-) comp21298_c1_seq1:187-612(-)